MKGEVARHLLSYMLWVCWQTVVVLLSIKLISGYVCRLELTEKTDRPPITDTATTQTHGRDYSGWNTVHTCSDNEENCLAVGEKGFFIIEPWLATIFQTQSVPLWVLSSH